MSIRTYEFKVTVSEGSDEFWEGLIGSKYKGYIVVEEIKVLIENLLSDIDVKVEISKYMEEH